MRTSRIKTKLARHEPTLAVQLHLVDPSVYELASLMGFDGLWMDMEHLGYSLETAQHLMRAARVGAADIIARPAKGEFMRMGRMLEAGAQGIMYPRCDGPEEAAEVVRWAKFAPLGRRGCDGAGADAPYCSLPLADYVRQANEETFVIIQLEERHALERADEIARVEGVDVLMLGPADLSITAGVPGEFSHPIVRDATRRVAEAAKRAGKHWGQPVFSTGHAQELLELGARFLLFGADIVMVKTGLEAIQRDFGSLGVRFDNRLLPR
jgi:4-hydroxy-2-oxoheptanedioate aldolase